MTIKCGVCEKEIPSHMVEKRRGSHYTKHYEDVEEILHEDLGKILDIRITDELKNVIEKIQKEKEPEIVKNALHEIFIKNGIIGSSSESIFRWTNSINDIKKLISHLNIIINISNKNAISIKSVDKIGRHQNWSLNKLHILDVDICVDCFSKFNHPKVTLGYLDRAIPQLKLQELNEDIWNIVNKCTVEIELKK